MRVILSRKGFDAGNGGFPSPILPDGTLLSLPINSKVDSVKFSDLHHGDRSYYDIIRELKPKSRITPKWTCHQDPDIRAGVVSRAKDWVGVFGQHSASQGHLRNQHVSEGDVFLFFGLFRQTEERDGKLCFKKSAPPQHIIFGYLIIDNIISDKGQVPDFAHSHPHVKNWDEYGTNNCIYTAMKVSPWDESMPGFGTFRISDDLILTKAGYSCSRWELPSFFDDIEISYHTKASHKPDYFQSASKGQEFVIEESNSVTNWARELIAANALRT